MSKNNCVLLLLLFLSASIAIVVWSEDAGLHAAHPGGAVIASGADAEVGVGLLRNRPPVAEYVHLAVYVSLAVAFALSAIRRLQSKQLHVVEAVAHLVLCVSIIISITTGHGV